MKKVGKVVLKFSSFLKQRVQKEMPPVTVLDVNGYDPNARNALHLQMQFSYSKVKPIKEELYRVFEDKKLLEQDMTSLSLGGDFSALKGQWDWPDEIKPADEEE